MCQMLTQQCGFAQAQGASSYILDLRKNPGGLVRAGVDVARLFLDAPAPVRWPL